MRLLLRAKTTFHSILNNQGFIVVLRLLMGSIFLVSAITKLASQGEFIHTVASYNILPYGLAGFYGSALPWIELFTGCFLILGVYSRFVSGISLALIISFVTANIYTLSGGTGVGSECGCFGPAMPLSHTGSLILDVVMLLMALPLVFHRSRLLSLSPSLSGIIRYCKFANVMLIVLIIFTSLPAVVVRADTIVTGATASYSGAVEPRPVSETAIHTVKPKLLYFYADTCGYCQREKPIIDELLV